MNSKKRNGEIQKNVEKSILDAVTKYRTDEPSFNPYDQREEGASTEAAAKPVEENQTELSLWNLIKNGEEAPPPEGLSGGKQNNSDNLPVFNFSENQKTQQVKFDVPPIPKIELPPAPVEFPPEARNSPNVAVGPEINNSAMKSFTDPVFNEGISRESGFTAIQAKLYANDHLQIAQTRIEDLEREGDRLRLENERLASAAALFQKRSEENAALNAELEKKLSSSEERGSEERAILKRTIEERDKNLRDLRAQIEDLEARLSNDVRKSRSRERELENRLELLRMEKISLVGAKDEIILDLKRQVDQLNHELGNYRKKAAELGQTIEANQEQFRRTVRALRLALTNLEVNEQIGGRLKKAE